MSELQTFRQEKDAIFLHDAHSPLTAKQKKDFSGLDYFDKNPDLVFSVEVEEFEQKEVVNILTSTGETQSYQRVGKITFAVDGKRTQLTLFASNDGFFLPFSDALSGKETYGAGRYLEPVELENGKLLIDFNYAYNPYCAYNDRWSCPMTPAENRLEVPIRAGERVFTSH